MDFAVLSPEEVRRSYKEAKDQKMQIDILCDLTCGTKKEVLDFLGIPNEIKECFDQKALELEYRKLYEEGLSDGEIAARTNRTKGMVQHWRKKERLPTKQTRGRKIGNQIPAERWHEVYRMRLNDKESGKILGVPSGSFRRFREKNGLEANRKAGRK